MMCEQMNIEPKEEDVPVDPADLTFTSQQAIMLFQVLPDRVADMSGAWLGKDYAGLMAIMEIYNMDDKRRVFDLLLLCIYEASKHYEQERKMRETKR